MFLRLTLERLTLRLSGHIAKGYTHNWNVLWFCLDPLVNWNLVFRVWCKQFQVNFRLFPSDMILLLTWCHFSDSHHSINQAICEQSRRTEREREKNHALALCHPYRTAVKFVATKWAEEHSEREKEKTVVRYSPKEGQPIYIPMKIYF